MRLNSLGRRAVTPAATEPGDSAINSSPAASVAAFQVARDREGKIAFHVTAPGAVAVEINGDFTNWTPMPLTADPHMRGQWSVTLPIAPGHYQMNVRVDGNKWMVPPGLLSMQDEFGGAVGLLVVQ
jgi:1,4-alpha-glucan branching enzyme